MPKKTTPSAQNTSQPNPVGDAGDSHNLARWRLVLGKDAEEHQIQCDGDEQCERIEGLVGFLFGEEGTKVGAGTFGG